MWEKKDECQYFGVDRHGLRTHLESKDPAEEDALWEFLARSAELLTIDPSSECKILPLKKPSFPLTPIEVFQKTPPLQRRKLFFKSLERGDIFYLKVIAEKTDCFKLLALDKYKGCMKIDDLAIEMDLPKLPQELKHLFPHSFSVIKAALSSCNIKERSLCVTLDKSIVKPEYQDVSLGPVYEPYNLHYHGNRFLGISFTDNLFMTGMIRVRNRLPELSNVGIKEKTEYSHRKKINKRVFSNSLSRTSLKQRLLQETASGYYKLALAAVDDGRVRQALSHIKQALYVWNEYPEALLLAGKCFNVIADTPNAFMCCMKTFESYPTATAARKHMCSMLVDAAKAHLSYKDRTLARESLEVARIVDPDNDKAVRLLREAKLLNKNALINPDEKYKFPCPFQEEVDVGVDEPVPKSKRKHHKRKTCKKKHDNQRHHKHHKSSKLSLSPKKSHETPSKGRMKSKYKSQFKEPLPAQSDPLENEETMKFLMGLIEKAQAECRLTSGISNNPLSMSFGSPHLPFSQETPNGHSSPFTPHIQPKPSIPKFAMPQPVQTSSPSAPQETLKTLYELAESAKREIQIQNQMKASKFMQPTSETMASEDTSILNTIISTTSKLLSITQDLVKNSPHSSTISQHLPLLQSHLLSNQFVAPYPINHLSEVNQVPPQIESAYPTQPFLTSPLCSDKLQLSQAPMFPLPAPENSSHVPPENDSSKQLIMEQKAPNSRPQSVQPNSIPFLEYPVASTSGHSFRIRPVNPNCSFNGVPSDSLVNLINTGNQIIHEDQSTSVPYIHSNYEFTPRELALLETKCFKPLPPVLNQSDMASDSKHKDGNTNETATVQSKKKTSPERSRRTPQRYRLTPPKRHERNASRRHRSRSPRRREGEHSHRKRDRSPRRRRSRSSRRSLSPRKPRSPSYSSRRYRSRSPGRSRSRSYGRSRSSSLKRSKSSSKRSRSGSPARYRRKIRSGTGKRSPSPQKSLDHYSRSMGSRSSISYDSSTANLCETVVSSPSFSDSSQVSVSNFESRSPSPRTELMKDIPPETPYRQSTPDFHDREISLVGFHRSQSPPWQRHVSITTKPSKHKSSPSSSSSLYPSSGMGKSFSGASSKESSFSDDRSLSPPKRAIPVICSRIVTYK